MLPAGERNAFLAQNCADAAIREKLRCMLQVPADPLAELAINSAATIAYALAQVELSNIPAVGARIASFELLEVIGEGGSAIVYRARRNLHGVAQSVALKLLYRGLFTTQGRQQFDRERRALAQLAHPNIARLIEGGVTEQGQAFIALDLVEGESITEYVRAHRLDLSARLALFAQVCRAVEAAHHALIVHRDLKPSNVLVTADGQVKLLDFGIAKLLNSDLDEQTQTHFRALTPAYAAPEQLTGGLITTATDVYALGLLLGEMLTGQRLSGVEGHLASAQITTNASAAGVPLAPAKWRKLIRGDLDNLVLKAIAADPTKRYASAGTLADDLDRFLQGRPVLAHPPSRWYRLGKFIARHRVAVLSSGSLLLALLVSLAVSLWQSTLARQEASRANAMRDFMVSAFAQAEPSVPRAGPATVIDAVKRALQTTVSEQGTDPRARLELRGSLAHVLQAQGDVEGAAKIYQTTLQQSSDLLGADHPETLELRFALAYNEFTRAEYAGARSHIDDLLRSVGTSSTPLSIKALSFSAVLASKVPDRARALSDSQKATERARVLGDPEVMRTTLNERSFVLFDAGDYPGAFVAMSEVLAINRRLFGEQHERVATAQSSIARIYQRLGNLPLAEQAAKAALDIDQAIYPGDHWHTATHLNALVVIKREQGDTSAALGYAEEALRIYRLTLGEEHPFTLIAKESVGTLQLLVENYSAAIPIFSDALSHYVKQSGSTHHDSAVVRAGLGFALAMSGERIVGTNELEQSINDLAARNSSEDLTAAIEKRIRVAKKYGDTQANEVWSQRLVNVPNNAVTPRNRR